MLELLCYAPNKVQYHLTGEEDLQDSRNVMIETARINRGDVKEPVTCDVNMFDGIVVVGGFGVAKNLSDFSVNGASCAIDESD